MCRALLYLLKRWDVGIACKLNLMTLTYVYLMSISSPSSLDRFISRLDQDLIDRDVVRLLQCINDAICNVIRV